MTIEGHKASTPRGPGPSGFSVSVVWFSPTRAGSPSHPVETTADLHGFLKPYEDHERLAVFLERDGGEAGAVWVHLTGDRAWVTHFTELGGVDSYCREPESGGPDELVGFLLDNGQLDLIHRSWTVTRAEGLLALAYFLQHGERDPSLTWVEQPPSLQRRAETGV